MNEVTVSAKTLDDAITEALIQLGATSDMVEYEVIEIIRFMIDHM